MRDHFIKPVLLLLLQVLNHVLVRAGEDASFEADQVESGQAVLKTWVTQNRLHCQLHLWVTV